MYLYFNFYRICSSCHQFRSEWCRSRQNLLSQKHLCIILSQRNLCISFQSTFTQTQPCSTSGHFYHTRHHIMILKIKIINNNDKNHHHHLPTWIWKDLERMKGSLPPPNNQPSHHTSSTIIIIIIFIDIIG